MVRQTRLGQVVTAIALPGPAGFKMIADGCRGVGFYPFLVMGILIDYGVEQGKYCFIAAGLEQPMPIYRFIRLRYVTYDFLCIVAMRSSGMYVGVSLIGVVLAVRTHQPEAEVIEQTGGG